MAKKPIVIRLKGEKCINNLGVCNFCLFLDISTLVFQKKGCQNFETPRWKCFGKLLFISKTVVNKKKRRNKLRLFHSSSNYIKRNI